MTVDAIRDERIIRVVRASCRDLYAINDVQCQIDKDEQDSMYRTRFEDYRFSLCVIKQIIDQELSAVTDLHACQ